MTTLSGDLAEVAVLAVSVLIESKDIKPKAMAVSATEQSRGLRQNPKAGLLSPEEALVW